MIPGEILTESGTNLVHRSELHPFVDRHHRFDDVEGSSGVSGNLGEGMGVLRKAGSSVAGAGVEKLRSDAVVEPHPFGHVVNVGADELAQLGHLVDEGDLRGEKGIGGILDEL